MTYFSYYFEEIGFKFALGSEQGAATPSWADHDAFPPLAPRQAVAASKQTLLKMLASYPCGEPEFEACALKKSRDRGGEWWYYEISWWVWPPECDGGDRSTITVPVMLNGRCPPYETFAWADRLAAWRS